MKKSLLTIIILEVIMSILVCTNAFAGPNIDAGIEFDLDATTYGNQNQVIITTPGVGEYLRVDCYAINVYNLDTYEFEVLYDSTIFEYVGSSATNPLTYEENILTSDGGTAVGWMVDTSNPGVLSIAYTLTGTDTLEAPEGEGLIADVVFKVLSDVGDTLRFGETSFYDTFGELDVITDKDEAIIERLVSIDGNEDGFRFEESRLYNYPNPAENTVWIEYAIKDMLKSEEVEINIYNARGQFVESIEGGNRRAVLDTKKYPTGVYFYKIKNDSFGKFSKIVLVH